MTDLVNSTDPFVGTVIQDRYRFLSRVGQGGSGEVYLVEHTLVGRRYALKLLHESLAKNPTVIARFHREARAAAAIGNAHIVEVVDMGYMENARPFLVMEQLNGRDLYNELLEKGPFSVERSVDIAIQCCQALQAAHEKGIVHRDIKPENIFITQGEDGTDFVKILDFGISKVLEAASEDVVSVPKINNLTWNGISMGTPQYMSLEQLNGCSDIDFRTDVYAAGVVLFEMLTGHVPFEASTFAKLVTQIANQDPPSPSKWRPDIPPKLEAVIHRSIAKDRQDRFSSMAEMASALLPFAGRSFTRSVAMHRDTAIPGTGADLDPLPCKPFIPDPEFFFGSDEKTPGHVEYNRKRHSTLPGIGAPLCESIAQEPQEDTDDRGDPPENTDFTTEIPGLRISKSRLRIAGGLIGVLVLFTSAVFAFEYAAGSGEETGISQSLPSGSIRQGLSATALEEEGRGFTAESAPTESVSLSDRSRVSGTSSAPSAVGIKNELSDQYLKRLSDSPHGDQPSMTHSIKGKARTSKKYARNRDRRSAVQSTHRHRVPLVSKRHSVRKPVREVFLSNRVRAHVAVTLTCESASLTIRVPPREQRTVSVPIEHCRVSCSGNGSPVCPIHLATDVSVIEIH